MTSNGPVLKCALTMVAAIGFSRSPLLALELPAPSPPQETAGEGLLDLPLDELLTLETTSVARKRQRVSESPAAVFVITQDDIRRSTASKISDLLRMVPGVEVGDQQTGVTAVSIRGFNSRVANSLLVMVDGRSIYVSAFSAVYWDQLMIPLTDIERIEVVRGPGAALWGSNAVNGVINIVTKHSSQYLGTTGDLRVGSRSQLANLTHSLRIGDMATLRLYAAAEHDDGLTDVEGKSLSRRWAGKELGGRLDFEPDSRNAFTLQADYSAGAFDVPFGAIKMDLLDPRVETVRAQAKFKTANILGRWTYRASDSLDWTLQTYLDHFDRAEFGASVKHELADLDFGLRWHANATHEFNIGLNAHASRDKVQSSSEFAFGDRNQTDTWLSGYLQDDISLVADRLRLIIGTKLEKNNITGLEVQPSVRLFVRPAPVLALWGAVSRAVRTPSRFERNAELLVSLDQPGTADNPGALPVFSRVIGTANRGSERLTAFEAGLRTDPVLGWSVDIATYYNVYDRLSAIKLRSVDPLFQSGVPYPLAVLACLSLNGSGAARTWGVEAAASRRVTSNWKLDFTYSHFDFRLLDDPVTRQRPNLLISLNASPRHQSGVRSSLDLGDRLSITTHLRYVDKLSGGLVPAYLGADARVTFRPITAVELSLVGENLLQKRRLEFTQSSSAFGLGYVSRSVAIQGRMRF